MADRQAHTPIEAGTNVDFENIHNFRDVARTMNAFLGEKRMHEGLLYRSARPDDATVEDRRRLKKQFGVETILDLRTKTEHANQAAKRRTDLSNASALSTNPALAGDVQIAGIQYLEVNINGKGFERSLFWQLSTWHIVKLLFLLLIRRRNDAIAVLARNVIQPRGVLGLATASLDHCGPEIADAMRLVGSTETGPILMHCTQGKDRTGLLALLIVLLVLCGSATCIDTGGSTMPNTPPQSRSLDVASTSSAPQRNRTNSAMAMDKRVLAAMSHDYLLSVPGLADEREGRLRENHAMGLSDDFADCPADFVERVVRYLHEKYGSVEDYLGMHGLNAEEMRSVRSKLLIEPGA